MSFCPLMFLLLSSRGRIIPAPLAGGVTRLFKVVFTEPRPQRDGDGPPVRGAEHSQVKLGQVHAGEAPTPGPLLVEPAVERAVRAPTVEGRARVLRVRAQRGDINPQVSHLKRLWP